MNRRDSRAQHEQKLVSHEKQQVSVPLDRLLEPLVSAAKQNCSWIEDFRDDEITLPKDLYDVLIAFSELKQNTTDRRAA